MAKLGETVATLKRLKAMAGAVVIPADSQRLTDTPAFGDNPGQLRMRSHVPAGARGLVVVLHGCTQTAEGYAEGAGWLTLAERHGFAVLAPEQSPSNNPNRCFNWFQVEDTRRGQGEAASIAAMIRRLVADHHLDSSRVYVTGLSAGGAMAAVMLAAYPELFAGGGIVAGLPYGAAASMPEAFDAMGRSRALSAAEWGGHVRSASGHAGPWPTVSVWHGELDRTVAPANADALASQWLDVHGLSGPADRTASSGGWRRQVWTDAAGVSVVEVNRFAALGHGAPLACGGAEGVGTAGPFLLETGVSSSLEMARSWGLTSETARPTATRPVASPRAARRAPPPPPAHPPANDVAGIINRALAAAGLLK